MELKETILNMIQNPDRENIKIELKSYKLLKEKKDLETIAQECIAFGNRLGGYLVIGVDDNGNFEGKGKFEPDRDKGDIENYFSEKISPTLNFIIDYFEYPKGDILVITVSRYKDIPFSIVEKNIAHISWRQYYYRESHGKRLISDQQLKYLFLNEAIDFKHFIRIVIACNKDLTMNYQLEEPKGLKQQYGEFLADLPENVKLKLLNNKVKINYFLLEISPYLFLRDIAYFFQTGWNIRINDLNKDMQDRIEYLEPLEYKELTIEDIPIFKGDSNIDELKFDLKKYFNRIIFPNFRVPKDLEINIIRKNNVEIILNLKHPNFNFEILFKSTTGGSNLITNHPQYTYLSRDLADYSFKEIKVDLSANLIIENIDNSLYESYISYTKNLRQLIEERFSYDYFLKHSANSIQYSILKKLEQIINMVKKKEKLKKFTKRLLLRKDKEIEIS